MKYDFLSIGTYFLSWRFSVSAYYWCNDDEIYQTKLVQWTKLVHLKILACKFQVSNLKTVGPSPYANSYFFEISAFACSRVVLAFA
jgi:hypothetical protein